MEQMKRNHYLVEPRCYKILTQLSSLPCRMVTAHDRERLIEFVLHALCNADCFDMKKAAFFIDNPDFHCFQGIAGFEDEHAYASDHLADSSAHWDKPDEFCDHMQRSEFNKKVRSVQLPSLAVTQGKERILEELATQLGLIHPAIYRFSLKHNNDGLVLAEHNEPLTDEVKEYVPRGMSLLAFCPIF